MRAVLVKAGLAAAVVIAAAVPLSRIDYRALYNGMYPANGLKRDVLSLCLEARPTFIRALRSERVHCYDSMPDNIELAIGWVRTTDRLAALQTPTPVERAERLLVEAALRQQLGLGPPQFTGYAAGSLTPCGAAAPATPPSEAAVNLALAESDQRLAQHIARGGDALALLGLQPKPRSDNLEGDELPALPLRGAETAASARGISGDAAAFAPRQAGALGAYDAPSFAATAAGCGPRV